MALKAFTDRKDVFTLITYLLGLWLNELILLVEVSLC